MTRLDPERVRSAQVAIADAIQSARRRAGMTQAQVAELSGISARAVGYAERAPTNAQAESLIRLFLTLNVDPSEAFGFTKRPEPEFDDYTRQLIQDGRWWQSLPQGIRQTLRELAEGLVLVRSARQENSPTASRDSSPGENGPEKDSRGASSGTSRPRVPL